jgi:threonine/homoserine/homoserine lactone efflux protein
VFWLLFQGVLIGLGAAAPLGPVNVEIARRTLRGGFGAGVALGAGAVSVDVAYAVLTSLSVGRASDRPAVSVVLAGVSVLILAGLGVLCLRSAWRGMTDAGVWEAGAAPSSRNGYVTGLLMTLVNPLTLAFWFTTLPSIAGAIDRRRLPWVAAGVFVGTFSWVLAFAGTLSVLGRFRRGAWVRATDLGGGITLIAFAVAVFLRSIRPHL